MTSTSHGCAIMLSLEFGWSTLGPKLGKALASTYGLRHSLDGVPQISEFQMVLGDTPLHPTFPPIFLCHLYTSLLIVTNSRRSTLTALISESDGHVM